MSDSWVQSVQESMMQPEPEAEPLFPPKVLELQVEILKILQRAQGKLVEVSRKFTDAAAIRYLEPRNRLELHEASEEFLNEAHYLNHLEQEFSRALSGG